MKTYSGRPHMWGNVLAAIDFETTGGIPGYHEIIQIAVVPLDEELEPHKEIKPFYMNAAPLYPERADKKAMEVNGLSLDDLIVNYPTLDRVTQRFIEWFDKLNMPFGKSLVPLAHNYAFEAVNISHWLGPSQRDAIFSGHGRDTMLMALAINDRAIHRGDDMPFPSVGLNQLCDKFHIVNENAHDALSDCIATAKLYKALLNMEVF